MKITLSIEGWHQQLMKKYYLSFMFIGLIVLTACSPQQSSPSLDDMKQMLTDAIQTEDGKKALRKTLSEEEFRELLTIEQPEVKKSIEEVLLSDEGKEFWESAFEDVQFTEAIAKSMKKQQEDVMKELMNDASFQKQFESLFQQPDMQKQLETILQSATMKEQYEKAIEEIIASPLLQSHWQQLIMDAGSAGNGENKQQEGKKEPNNEQKSGEDS